MLPNRSSNTDINAWRLSELRISSVERAKNRYKVKLKWNNDSGIPREIIEDFGKINGGETAIICYFSADQIISFQSSSSLYIEITEIHRIRQHVTRKLSESIQSLLDRAKETEQGLKEVSLSTSDSAMMKVKLIFRIRDNRLEEVKSGLKGVTLNDSESSELAGGLAKAAINSLNRVSRIGSAVAELNPISKAVFVCIDEILKGINEDDLRDQTIADLLESMSRILPFAELADVDKDDSIGGVVVEMLDIVQQASQFVVRYQHDGKAVRVLKSFVSSSAQDEVDEFVKRFKSIKEDFDRAIAVETKVAAINSDDARVLSSLNPVIDSDFDYDENRFCMPGTRIDILDRLTGWSCDTTTTPQTMLWLFGMAGLGKSSIAASLCQKLRDSGSLGGSFFCQQDHPQRSQPKFVIPTLAFRFSQQWPPYRRCLLAALRDSPDIVLRPIGDQMRRLIIEPVRSSLPKAPKNSFVFLVDGLDECGSEVDLTRIALINALSALSLCVPWIRVLVTGRPELAPSFQSIGSGHLSRMNLYDEPGTDSDITFFLKTQLNRVAVRRKLLKSNPDWPGENNISQLAKQSCGLFIWAHTVYHLLYNCSDPNELLYDVISDKFTTGGYEALHLLYRKVLQRAVGNLELDCERFRTVLGAIIVTSSLRPLPDAALVQLLQGSGINDLVFENLVEDLSAVIYRNAIGAAQIYHLSFSNFVLDDSAGTLCPPEYRLDITHTHTSIAQACLSTITDTAYFNRFSIPSSSVFNDDSSMSHCVKEANLDPLRYCCTHWGDHVALSAKGDQFIYSQIGTLLSESKILAWLEVTSLTGELDSALRSVVKCVRWIDDRQSPLASLALSLQRFILALFEPISRSAAHIYISGIAFLADSSKLRQLLLSKYSNASVMVRGRDREESAVVQSWKAHKSDVQRLEVSRDGRFIVSCAAWFNFGTLASDTAVHVWDGSTSRHIYTLERIHEQQISSLSISNDCHKLACASTDGQISTWILQSGDPIGQKLVRTPKSELRDIKFFPDNRRLLAAYEDRSVVIWSLASATITGPAMRHKEEISRLAISHDDNFFLVDSAPGNSPAIADSDSAVTLWASSAFGSWVAVKTLTFPTRYVSVAFSPTINRLAILADRLQLYEYTRTDLKMLVQCNVEDKTRGYSRYHTAWSPSGDLLVTGRENTFHLWSTSETSISRATTFIYEGERQLSLSSLTLNSDRLVLSGHADGSIRVIDAPTVDSLSSTSEMSPGSVTVAAFSLSNMQVITGDETGLLQVYEIQSQRQLAVMNAVPLPRGIVFCANSNYFLVMAEERIELWSSVGWQKVDTQISENPCASPNGCHYASFTTRASGGRDRDASIWSLSTDSSHLPNKPRFSVDLALQVLFSSDSERLAVKVDSGVLLYNIDTSELLRHVPDAKQFSGLTLGPSLIGYPIIRKQLSDSEHENVNDFVLMQEHCSYEDGSWKIIPGYHKADVITRTFSHNGQYSATADRKGTIRIVDVELWQQHGYELSGHESSGCLISDLAWSPDDRYLLSWSADGSARVWDAAAEIARGPNSAPSGTSWDAENEGWLRDDEGLVIWVPVEYRRKIFGRELMALPESGARRAISVDWSRLCWGKRWAETLISE